MGTRGSRLALVQTEMAVQALISIDNSLHIETTIIKPKGDIDTHSPIPLDTIGKGWFSQEIEAELLAGRIDIAVHSLKDMQELPDGLVIGAYLAREDARDALITKNGEPLERLRKEAIIGTDSTRRQVQMQILRPDVVMKSIRGNVPHRIEKLTNEPYDAIILAVAGLKRLGMADRITRYFSPDEMTPSPGQGIIAVEARKDDARLLELLTKINDAEAAHAAHIERTFSHTVGGGCKAPTGAYCFREDAMCVLIGMTTRDDGSIFRKRISVPWAASRELGETLGRAILLSRA